MAIQYFFIQGDRALAIQKRRDTVSVAATGKIALAATSLDKPMLASIENGLTLDKGTLTTAIIASVYYTATTISLTQFGAVEVEVTTLEAGAVCGVNRSVIGWVMV